MSEKGGAAMQLVTEIYGGEPYAYYPLGDHVVRAPGVCGGRPTFKYTRIEIVYVLRSLASGESVGELVEGFAGRVSAEAIREAGRIVTHTYDAMLPPLPDM